MACEALHCPRVPLSAHTQSSLRCHPLPAQFQSCPGGWLTPVLGAAQMATLRAHPISLPAPASTCPHITFMLHTSTYNYHKYLPACLLSTVSARKNSRRERTLFVPFTAVSPGHRARQTLGNYLKAETHPDERATYTPDPTYLLCLFFSTALTASPYTAEFTHN